jgi:hypothetical protein
MAVLIGLAILQSLASCTKEAPHPLDPLESWRVVGNQASSYEFGIDKGIAQDGSSSAAIRSIKDTIDGFGAIMQSCAPDAYLGRRVRMTGYIKTQDVSQSASLWFRVDSDTMTVSFDNMHDGKADRSIRGTTDWTRYEIVLDVPSNATSLSYGALLSGPGQVWCDNIAFEVVDSSVATTGVSTPSDAQHPGKDKGVLTKPLNLSFEK